MFLLPTVNNFKNSCYLLSTYATWNEAVLIVILFLNPYNPIKQALLPLLFYRLENLASEMLNNLPEVTLFVNGRVGINSLLHFNIH